MSCSGKIFKELKKEPVNVKMVWMISEQLVNCRDTTWKGNPVAAGEFITSYGNMGEMASLSKKLVRSAFARLSALGLLEMKNEARRFCRVRLLSQGTVSGAVRGAVSGTVRTSPKVLKQKVLSLISTGSAGTDSGADQGTDSGNSVVSRSSGVSSSSRRLEAVVSPVVSKTTAVAAEPPAPPPAAADSLRQTEWARDVLLKDCPLYLADEKLMAIDDRTGAVAIVDLHKTWRSAYPAVDVVAEIRKAHAWEVSNPSRRKVNRSKFLNNWLSTEQDRGGTFKNGPTTSDRKKSYDSSAPRELPAARTAPPPPREPRALTPKEIADAAEFQAKHERYKMTKADVDALEEFKRRVPTDDELAAETRTTKIEIEEELPV